MANAYYLLPKMSELQIIADTNPDFIVITETFLNNSIYDAEITLPSYLQFRADRSTGNRRGGVVIYVKNDANPRPI